MPKKKPYHLQRFGITYIEGGKCPACSSEKDNGGRLCLHKRKNKFLKCDRCKYAIHTERAVLKQEQHRQRRDDKILGIR